MIYDLVIIGGGPAGYSAALEAVKYGLSVILFEKEQLGGTCLNKGCVPTKILTHSAEIYSQIRNSSKYGIASENAKIDFSVTTKQMNGIVEQLRDNLRTLLQQKKIEIVAGRAGIKDPHTVECQNTRYVTKNILIATGSEAAEPLLKESFGSDETLRLERIPNKIKIIGGGVAAVEFANIFNKFGSDVTIAIRGERILRKWDKELAVSISQSLKKQGVKIITKCTEKDFSDGEFDIIISLVGRIPRLNGIDNLSITLDNNKAIITDEFGRTNIENIFAAGDVVSGSPMLAHIGMEQGRRIARYIAGEAVSNPSVIASCIYMSPEIATVGFTEAEAKANGIETITGKQNMASNARTMIAMEERNFIKVVADRSSHKIIGAQLMCNRASDIVSEFVVAINNGLTIENIRDSVHPHPSFSEAIIDVMNIMIERANGL